ncbi:hypothetical protein D3C81_2037480 [compost metagenome]
MRVVRSSSLTPRIDSSRWTRLVTDGWVTCRRSAAWLKLPVSATARKVSSSTSLIPMAEADSVVRELGGGDI